MTLSSFQRILFFLFITALTLTTNAQTYQTETHTENGFTYETVTNDPLKARIYTLKNGLKVYMTVYKDAPRIQTYIAVRAGSKFDPTSATGLAHYLEHILFKGTSKIGTSDWQHEKKELDKIEDLFEKYRSTTDTLARRKIYHQIDSISLVAASYSIANEYDKMLGNIGATGTNAYTSVEQTVYVNEIPSNQIEKWTQIEAERFSEMVPRLFHTELEAVYEEKNRALDNDNSKMWEALTSGLFPNHPYGTQTTIGTVEHLKNPSIKEIEKYFEKYYVPNNMAICLSGDFDPATTIELIDKYFGKMHAKPLPEYEPVKEPSISTVIEKDVFGPTSENLIFAYRFSGLSKDKRDSYRLKIISSILSNGDAGLIDLNLVQQQKVLSAYSYEVAFNDYSFIALGGRPKNGQTLEEVKKLLLEQIELVKKGEFPDWLIKAIIDNMEISKLTQFESNKARADLFVDAFVSGLPWETFVEEIEIMKSISKKEIIDFAARNFGENYVTVYKRKGPDPSVQKVIKPSITAVAVNREKQSEFYTNVFSKPSENLEPVYVDFEKEILRKKTKSGIEVLSVKNQEHDLFSLTYLWNFGKDNDPLYAVAVGYLDLLGTKKYSPEKLKEEFYKLGSSYSMGAGGDYISFTVSGKQEYFNQTLTLFEELVTSAKADEAALKEYIQRILKSRKDSKLSKDVILRTALVNYAKHGPINPFTNIVKERDLLTLTPDKLTSLIKNLQSIKHEILYYGPVASAEIVPLIEKIHVAGKKIKPEPALKTFPFRECTENEVLWVDYDMVQAEIMFVSKSIPFEVSNLAKVLLFNEYFGGGMGSLVFQEMRESRALAYSVNSRYENASRKDFPNFITSYIGTQADKLNEAVEGLQDLIDNMPLSESLFKNAKTSTLEVLVSNRITKGRILTEYLRLKKLGINYDYRKDVYNAIKGMTFEDIKSFQTNYLKGKKKSMLVIASESKISVKDLEKYGKVRKLTLEEIFGY